MKESLTREPLDFNRWWNDVVRQGFDKWWNNVIRQDRVVLNAEHQSGKCTRFVFHEYIGNEDIPRKWAGTMDNASLFECLVKGRHIVRVEDARG